MKLLVLIGNVAAGKMTVGQELMKITDMRLFHNHMSIELVIEVFGSRIASADRRIREVVFEEFAKSDLYGMIFTYMWAFDRQEDWDYIDDLCDIFRRAGAEVYYAELVASQAVRLERNITANRLHNKASKRDIESSSKWLISADTEYRCESFDGEVPFEDYIKIDNTGIPPETAARIIKERFNL